MLPEYHHASVCRELARAWAIPDAEQAEAALRNLAAKIERTHPDAAASLREGLTDSITINRLGVTGTLAKTLAPTRESTVDIMKAHARNVKCRHTGDMRLRWAAAGMFCAEAQYRRVNGYRQLDRLADNITAELQRRQLHLTQAS